MFLLLGVSRAISSGALSLNGGPGPSAQSGPGPDIYLLLFDAYPRADTLRTDFQWDNAQFIERMATIGFETASASHSNYNATALTLATMFNMAQVQDLVVDPPDSPAAQFRLASELLNQGRGLDVLRSHGYEIVTIPSPVSNVTLYSADRILDHPGVTDLELSILQVGLLPQIVPDGQRSWLSGSLRDRTRSAFVTLQALAAERVGHPRFIFSHVMSPHAPTLFAPDDREQLPWPCFPRECAMFYGGQHYGDAVIGPSVAQIQWLNDQIEETARGILAKSESPPVIIVMSDHGFRRDFDDESEMVRTLFMANTPGQPRLFPNDSSPVNILPRLMDAYLAEDIPLAPESTFVMDMRAVSSAGLFELRPWTP